MLVLSRFVGEKIYINKGMENEICITLLNTSYGQAKIGIAAPQTMNIVREELVYRDQRNNECLADAEGYGDEQE